MMMSSSAPMKGVDNKLIPLFQKIIQFLQFFLGTYIYFYEEK